MKLIALLFLFVLAGFSCLGQKRIIDSLYKDLAVQKTDTGKAISLYNLSFYYNMFKPDSAMLLAQKAFDLSKKNNFLRGESWALNGIANAYLSLHNYPKAIEHFIEQLKIEEKRGIPENIGATYLNMALAYNSEREVKKALYYAAKAESLAMKYKLNDLLLYSKLNIGDIYEKAEQLSRALKYTNAAYELAQLKKNDLITGTSLNNMANIFVKLGDYKNARLYYSRSVPYLLSVEDYNTLSECNLGLAKVNKAEGKIDSAVYYAKKVYDLAIKNEFMTRAVDASAFLVQLYKSQNNIDSAFAYQEITINLSNSIDSKERAKAVQSITISEEIRQKEISEAILKEAEERKQKLQLLAIGIFIPILFFISIFLSQRKVNRKLIEFSGVVSLLMFFEYLTLFIHPFVSEKSHHSPIIEIVAFVVIASLLTPTHHKIEHWLISKLSKIHERHVLSRKNALHHVEEIDEEIKPETAKENTI